MIAGPAMGQGERKDLNPVCLGDRVRTSVKVAGDVRTGTITSVERDSGGAHVFTVWVDSLGKALPFYRHELWKWEIPHE